VRRKARIRGREETKRKTTRRKEYGEGEERRYRRRGRIDKRMKAKK
jgi:hypothetical protein